VWVFLDLGQVPYSDNKKEVDVLMIEALKANSLFSGLTDSQRAQLLETAQCRILSNDEILFLQGNPAQQFYWLESGLVKLFRSSATGEEKIIEIVRPGHTFAEAIMFMDRQQGRYPVSAQAIAAGKVWCFNNQQFLNLLRGSVDGCFRMLATMSQRLHHHVKEIDRLTLQTATERVINYLLQELPPEATEQGEVRLPIAKQTLAATLSIKPETFSRTLAKLSKEGLLEIAGNTIRLTNVQALRQRVEV